jgi:hypothetical protein
LTGAVTAASSVTLNGPLTLKKSTATGSITVTAANTATGAAAVTTKVGSITFTTVNAGADTFAADFEIPLTLTGAIIPTGSLIIAQVQSHTTVGTFIVSEAVSAAGTATVLLRSMDAGGILAGTTLTVTYLIV